MSQSDYGELLDEADYPQGLNNNNNNNNINNNAQKEQAHRKNPNSYVP